MINFCTGEPNGWFLMGSVFLNLWAFRLVSGVSLILRKMIFFIEVVSIKNSCFIYQFSMRIFSFVIIKHESQFYIVRKVIV